jgi:SAM-dependent methyltransferase
MRSDPQTLATRAFFDREASGWSSQYRPGASMADRVERFLSALRGRVILGSEVLDLGCGTGEIAAAAAAAGWRVTGADLSPAMIDAARQRSGGVEWITLDPASDALPFDDARFAAVWSSSVLEYVAEPQPYLSRVARVLEPGGWFIATVPDMRHPLRQRERRKRRVALWDPAFRLIGRTRWRTTYEYLRLSINRWPPEEWLALLARAGFAAEPVPACDHPLLMLLARR